MESLSFVRKMGLFSKIAFMVLAMLTIAIGVTTVLSIRQQTKTIETALIEKNKILSIHLASSAKNAFWSLNWFFVERQLQEVARSENVIFLQITKANGEVYLASGDKEFGENVLAPESVRPERQIVKDVIYTKTGEINKLIITPIEIGDERWSLTMALSLKQIKEAKEHILKVNIIWAGIIFLLGVSVSFLFAREMTRPIKQLVEGTKEIGRGNLDYRIKIKGLDELGNLADSFNNMAEDLKKTTTSRDQLAKEIEERKQAEKALRESEERFRDISYSMADWIWEVDKDGKYTFASESAKEILGYDSEELIGKTPFELMPEDEAKRKREAFKIIASEKKPIIDLENWNLTKQGKRVCLLTNGVPILNKKGELCGYRGVDKDITEQKKLEAQFIQAQKMEAVGRLTGGMAHDFNNILTAIIGNASLLASSIREDDPMQENVEEINDAANRAASLTRQLLAFSRKQILKSQILDLNAVISGLMKMLGRLIGEDVNLKTVLASELRQVEADPGQMEQVIMNLVVNARDAMPQGGKLTIETHNVYLDETYAREHGVELKPGPYVMLSITDTGIGMDEETQSHIFEPFFTTKEKDKGTGLGLATVYGIIKQTGGYIWAYSEPGKGTTFKIYLTGVEKETEPVRRDSGALEGLTGSETVLLVEDDKSVLNLARKILKKYGYNVLEAESGEHALKVSGQYEGPVHLLVTDVVMPEMSGLELAKHLQVLRPGIKVLYMSGFTNNATIRHGILTLGVKFIEKPFSPESLVRKIREVLEQ
ncbi:MAG: PAS domain S-box protein [Desulfobacterales bacterium]|nr:PAS domain S-box protein [Desulfobacterales bacterium]